MKFLQHTLIDSTVGCGEFNQGLRSDWLIAADFIKSLGPDKLKSLKAAYSVTLNIFRKFLFSF